MKEAEGAAASDSVAKSTRPGGFVLVVDDDDTVRKVSVRLLERDGYRCLEAGSGQQAIDLCRDADTDILAVVLDLTMPGKSGRETFQEIRHLRPDIPVLLVSGYSDSPPDGSVTETTDFLAKPFTPEQLRAKLAAILS